MVHKHRTAYKAAFAKDVSPMRNMAGASKSHVLSSSPADTKNYFLGSSRLQVPKSNGSVASSSNNNKWQYNDMIANNRDQFNQLHFC